MLDSFVTVNLGCSLTFKYGIETNITFTGSVGNRTEANALDAAAQGAGNAVFLVMNIIANLIAFLAFVAFLNGVLSWLGGLVGADYITFQVPKRPFL